jgi:hypothetical protein
VLAELNAVEQRLKAVLEVHDGASVTLDELSTPNQQQEADAPDVLSSASDRGNGERILGRHSRLGVLNAPRSIARANIRYESPEHGADSRIQAECRLRRTKAQFFASTWVDVRRLRGEHHLERPPRFSKSFVSWP